jgi:hypothetical protein
MDKGGRFENLPFFVFSIFIYIKTNKVIMKPEYKEKALGNIEAIEKRISVIREMMEGKRPADQKLAVRYAKEIERGVELTKNIVDIS